MQIPYAFRPGRGARRLVALLLAGLSGPALAQGGAVSGSAPIGGLPHWQWLTPQPTGYELTAAHLFSDSSLIAVGCHATAVRTRDDGRSWQVLPMPAGQDHDLTSVSFADSLNGWIGAETGATVPTHVRTGAGRVLHTTDGGASWTAQAIGESQSTANPHVVALSATEALVFSTRQRRQLVRGNWTRYPAEPRVRRTVNGGRTWTALPPLPTGSLVPGNEGLRFISYSFPTAATGYVVLSEQEFSPKAILLRTTDRGQTWQNVSPDTLSGFVTGKIWFLDANNGWATGGRQGWGMNVGPKLYRTRDGGAHWTPVVSPVLDNDNLAYLAEITFADTLRGLALNFDKYRTTTDGGRTWQETGYAFPLYRKVITGRLNASGKGWLLGEGVIGRTADYGQSWQPASRLSDFTSFRTVQFPTPTHGWALPVNDLNIYNRLPNRVVLRTTDRGAHWQVQDFQTLLPALFGPLGNGYTSGGAFPDPDTAWVVGSILRGGIYEAIALRTTDGGSAWAQQTLPAGSTIYYPPQIGAWGTRRAVLTMGTVGGTMAVTRDGGQSWTRPVTPTTRTLFEVTWADSATVYVTTDTSQLLKSTDAGRSWQVLPLQALDPQAGYLAPITRPALTFVSAQVGYFVAGDWFVRTTDGGQTWRLEKRFGDVGTPDPMNYTQPQFSAMAWHGPRDAFAISKVDVFSTHDAGQTWAKLAYVCGGYYRSATGYGPAARVDRYNAFFIGNGLTRYSEKYLQTDTAATQRTVYCAGDTATIAFDTVGTFAPTERDFRVELSNRMGRFRPHETTLLPLVGNSSASPLRAVLPAGLTTGTRYRLRVIRADSSVLGGDNQHDVSIYARPAAVAVAPADSARVCAGDSVELVAPAGFGQYAWSTGATTASVWVRAAGAYSVRVAAGGGCFGPASAPVTVRVTPRPAQPAFTVQAQSSGIVVLTSNSSTGNQWLLNGQPISGATAQTYAVTTGAQSGAYSLTVTQGGCASPAAAAQTITVTGLDEAADALPLTLLPNPARQYVALSSAVPLREVLVTDLAGRQVLRRLLAGATRAELPLTGLPSGVYLLHVRAEAGQTRTRRLLVEH